MSPLLADIVVKRFCPSKRAILIQGQRPIRNVDSKGWPLRFDCCVEGVPRRLLQQNRHISDLPRLSAIGRFRGQSGHQAAVAEQSRFMSTRPSVAGIKRAAPVAGGNADFAGFFRVR
jgi:hypothetical protein